jgi:tetratricopeptide (TPR) repeat protein
LRRGDTRVDLSPRLVEILGYLAARPGETVPKDVLLDRFWPDVHVTENTVDRAMTRIRKAVEENPAQPKFIQTVARRGYRFIGPVDDGGGPPQADALELWMKGRGSLEALDAGQLQDATEMFERLLAANPGYASAHAAIANAYFLQYELTRPDPSPNRELLQRAIAHAQRACAGDPASGEAWATLGFVLTAAGDVDRARTAARRATVLQPDSWRHHFRHAMACWGQERLDAVDRTLSFKPGFAPAIFVKAMVFVARQAYAAAEEVAARGAAQQSLDAVQSVALPSFGLHWLVGLLQLRRGAVAEALESFGREIDHSRRSHIYSREYRVNALVGEGYAHMTAGRPEAALSSFSQALDTAPHNGRALLGLQCASRAGGRPLEADTLEPRVQASLAELQHAGRLADAGLLQASMYAARADASAACAVLLRALQHAPPGQCGWSIPIEPALAPLRDCPAAAAVLTLLSSRAG